MSAPSSQPAPLVPPRPSRSKSQDKNSGSGTGTGPPPPAIPPRPSRRFNRSVSPNPDRFAPSPLNETSFAPKNTLNSSHRTSGLSASHLGHELERSTSVELPGPGEEGQEYAVIEDHSASPEEPPRRDSTSPEQTRTVGEDIKLHAPKPTMPAQSAKQRVAAVTRTDSDRAAAFGIGRPSSAEQRSLKKKASTTSQLSQAEVVEEGHGIPEIGQRVPMYPNAGDVQAPSPAPTSAPAESVKPSRSSHSRKSNSRGFNELPPGSYGLHGHGVAATDKMEKAYYEKHPELLQKEQYKYQHDRPNDFSLSKEDLNKIVRDTASRGAGPGTSLDYTGTPSEQVGFQASEEYASRMSRPPSAVPKDVTSPKKSAFPGSDTTAQGNTGDDGNDVIHVEDQATHQGYINFGDEQSATGGTNDGYVAPILAPDEVAKDPTPHELHPAVEPPPERHGSAFEIDGPKSRPTSRPASVYSPPPPELHSTPLEDVREYEPLFTDDEKSGKQPITAEKLKEIRQRFPSRDIWEDAPNSVHATAEVSTPELSEAFPKPPAPVVDIPSRETETPAQAFARKQEELAEKEALTPDSFLHRQQKSQTPAGYQSHAAKEVQTRPSPAHRFPSRDVWEDTPDSLQFTTTVSGPQSGKDTPPDSPATAAPSKPTIPVRPKKQGSGDDADSKPAISERPGPRVPARPSKSTPEPKTSETVAKPKPPVPARPAGGKIAALQAGFMSDLNKRLQLGPQAPKKDEPTESPDATEEKAKKPLSDARKGRARGPQRRAPTKTAPSSTVKSTPPPASNGKPVLSFSMTRTLFSIDEEGTITVEEEPMSATTEEPKKVAESVAREVEQPKTEEPKLDESKSGEPKLEEAAQEMTEEKPIKEAAEEEATKAPEPEPEAVAEAKDADPTSQPGEPDKANDEVPKQEQAIEAAAAPEAEETKTLVANTAGEPILEETIEKKPGDQVEEVVNTKDEVVDRT